MALSLAVGALFILAIGEDPLAIYALMLRESLGTGYGIGQTLFKATPLIFTGLAVALGFRAGLFNIGAEGQLYLGGLAAALTGTALAGLPGVLLLPLALLAAAAAGAAWGAVPGLLKARFGAHEVINTIMLNFIAFALASFLGRFLFEPATVRTAAVGAGAEIARLDVLFPALRGSPVNFSLLLALLAAAGTGLLLFGTRLGYELRAVGLNAPAAEYGGVSIGRVQVAAMALSGALAGLGGRELRARLQALLRDELLRRRRLPRHRRGPARAQPPGGRRRGGAVLRRPLLRRAGHQPARAQGAGGRAAGAGHPAGHLGAGDDGAPRAPPALEAPRAGGDPGPRRATLGAATSSAARAAPLPS